MTDSPSKVKPLQIYKSPPKRSVAADRLGIGATRHTIGGPMGTKTANMRSFWSNLEKNESDHKVPSPQSSPVPRSPLVGAGHSGLSAKRGQFESPMLNSPSLSHSSGSPTKGGGAILASPDSLHRKSSIVKKASWNKLHGPRQFGARDEPVRQKKVVTFDKTDEVVEYENDTPEVSPDMSKLSYENTDDECEDVPVIEPGDDALGHARPLPQLPVAMTSQDTAQQDADKNEDDEEDEQDDGDISGSYSRVRGWSPRPGEDRRRDSATKKELSLGHSREQDFHENTKELSSPPRFEMEARPSMEKRIDVLLSAQDLHQQEPRHVAPSPSIPADHYLKEGLYPAASPASSVYSEDLQKTDEGEQFESFSLPMGLARKESLLDSQRQVTTQHHAQPMRFAVEPSAAQVQRTMSQKRRSIIKVLEQGSKKKIESIQEEITPDTTDGPLSRLSDVEVNFATREVTERQEQVAREKLDVGLSPQSDFDPFEKSPDLRDELWGDRSTNPDIPAAAHQQFTYRGPAPMERKESEGSTGSGGLGKLSPDFDFMNTNVRRFSTAEKEAVHGNSVQEQHDKRYDEQLVSDDDAPYIKQEPDLDAPHKPFPAFRASIDTPALSDIGLDDSSPEFSSAYVHGAPVLSEKDKETRIEDAVSRTSLLAEPDPESTVRADDDEDPRLESAPASSTLTSLPEWLKTVTPQLLDIGATSPLFTDLFDRQGDAPQQQSGLDLTSQQESNTVGRRTDQRDIPVEDKVDSNMQTASAEVIEPASERSYQSISPLPPMETPKELTLAPMSGDGFANEFSEFFKTEDDGITWPRNSERVISHDSGELNKDETDSQEHSVDKDDPAEPEYEKPANEAEAVDGPSTIRSSSNTRSKARPSLTPLDVARIHEAKESGNTTGKFRHVSEELSKTPVPLLELAGNDEQEDSLFGDLEREFDDMFSVRKRGYTVRENSDIVVAKERKVSVDRRVSSPIKKIVPKKKSEVPPVPTLDDAEKLELERGVTIKSTQPVTPAQSSALRGPGSTPVIHNFKQPAVLNEMPTDERGRLLIKMVSVENMDLPGIDTKGARFNVTLDNGVHCISTPFKPLRRTATVEEEFELTVSKDGLEFILTFKAKYSKHIPRKAVPPPQVIPEKGEPKHGLSKIFGSKKRTGSSASPAPPIQTPSDVARLDSWHNVVATDGSFGRCYINFSQYEKDIYGRAATFEVTCFNEWATNGVSRTRRDPYKIGKVKIQMMFLPRVKKTDSLPRSIHEALEVLDRYRQGKPASIEGHLSQLGGDCQYWRRRFFILEDSTLIAHSEISRKPRATINLAKAVKVVGDKNTLQEPVVVGKNRRRSAFAEKQEGALNIDKGFRIRFANGEIIDFFADSNADKQAWISQLILAIGKRGSSRPAWVDSVMYDKPSSTASA